MEGSCDDDEWRCGASLVVLSAVILFWICSGRA